MKMTILDNVTQSDRDDQLYYSHKTGHPQNRKLMVSQETILGASPLLRHPLVRVLASPKFAL